MSQTLPLPLSDKPTVELHTDALDLELVALQPGESPCLETRGGRAVTTRMEGDVTHVELTPSWNSLFDVPRRLTLRVPAHVRARITNDAGRVDVTGLAGCDLELKSHAGTLTLDEVRGRLVLSVASGTIKGNHLGGTFDVRSTAGSVRLQIDALDAGAHLVRTGMGAVKVELAKGLAVRIETAATLGSARSTYPSQVDAPALLRLEADLGSVKVREASASEDPRHGDWPDWRRTWNDVVKEVREVLTTPARSQDASQGEVRRVLELVHEGKLSVDDAERLLRAIR